MLYIFLFLSSEGHSISQEVDWKTIPNEFDASLTYLDTTCPVPFLSDCLLAPPDFSKDVVVRIIRNELDSLFGQRGAFARRDLPAGYILDKFYAGVIISSNMSSTNFMNVLAEESQYYSSGRFESDAGDDVVDAEFFGNEIRYINDYRNRSSSWNVVTSPDFEDGYSVWKPIKAGEELLVDYGPDYAFSHIPSVCELMGDNCGGFLGEESENDLFCVGDIVLAYVADLAKDFPDIFQGVDSLNAWWPGEVNDADFLWHEPYGPYDREYAVIFTSLHEEEYMYWFKPWALRISDTIWSLSMTNSGFMETICPVEILDCAPNSESGEDEFECQ